MMSKKTSDINDARRQKHAKTGSTMKEIMESEARRLRKNKHLSKNEPSNLVSGDMDKFLRGGEDDDHEEDDHE